MEIAPAKPLSHLRKQPGLFAFDMDSTLVDGEGVDEFARELGRYDEVARVTEAAMRGEMDFAESLRQRVSLLRGLTIADVDRVYDRMPLMPGAIELFSALRAKGHKTAILSGGFDLLAERYARDLGGVDFVLVNQLELIDGVCTGALLPPIVDAEGKARGLEEAANLFGIPLSRTVATGDGANDILMLRRAGFGISFCGKPKLRTEAKFAIEEKNLARILDLI